MRASRHSTTTHADLGAQAQTPQQRRANLKFAKEQEAKMGKSTEEIKKMTKKETAKAPISPIWLGMRRAPALSLLPIPSMSPVGEQPWLTAHCFSNEQVSSRSSSSAA